MLACPCPRFLFRVFIGDAAVACVCIMMFLHVVCPTQVSYFLVGNNIKTFPTFPSSQLAAGHTISSHSMTHPSLSTLTLANVAKELNDARAEFVKNTCIDPTLYRPPFGDTSTFVQALAHRMGQRGVLYVHSCLSQ